MFDNICMCVRRKMGGKEKLVKILNDLVWWWGGKVWGAKAWDAHLRGTMGRILLLPLFPMQHQSGRESLFWTAKVEEMAYGEDSHLESGLRIRTRGKADVRIRVTVRVNVRLGAGFRVRGRARVRGTPPRMLKIIDTIRS